MIYNIDFIILVFDVLYLISVLENWSLEVLFGVPFRPNLDVGGSFWGSFWARGAALGSLLGVGAEGWASGVHGQRHSCAERLSGSLREAPPASNPNSRLRSQGSRATGKRGSNSHPGFKSE